MKPALWALLLLLPLLPARAEDPTEPASGPFDPGWKKRYAPEDDSWKSVPQELTYIETSDPETLDPAVMTGVPEHTLALALYEGLVSQDPETLEPRPGVASRWERSGDGRTYTFHLRPDAKWSNGEPLTSEDFRWSIFRAQQPLTQCDYVYMFDHIEGFEAFRTGGARDDYAAFQKSVKVETPDPRTLRVTLRAPTAYFLDLCAFETYMPVHRATVEKHGEQWTRAEHWVGNGPFVLKEWAPRQHIVLVPNPHYWDAGFVKLRRITNAFVEDLDQAHNKFLKSEAHWTRTIPLSRVEEVASDPRYFVMPFLGSYFYRLNVDPAKGKPALRDKRVRQALSLAINRQTITRDVTRLGEIPATWFTPAMNGYEPPKGLPYDPDRARALLAEAGFPSGKGFPVLTLVYNTQDHHKVIAERVSQMWRETLGITVSLRNKEWKVYLKDVELGEYDIARAGWIADYSDPNSFLDMWVTDGGNNNTGWGNETYDRLIREAAFELDPEKRFEIFRKAESMLVEDEFPILPIYIYVNKGMKVEELQGWYENIRDLHPFQFMYFVPPAK